MYSCGPIHMDEERQDDQLDPTYSSSVSIRDVALKTCQKQWTIGRSGERGSGIPVLMAQRDDDYNLRRTGKLLKSKPCSRNLNKGINTRVVPLVTYSGLFLKWTREEFHQMDQRTRKLTTMLKTLHPRDDVDRLQSKIETKWKDR